MRYHFSITRHGLSTDLATCARAVFSVLGISNFEERFSSNYPPDDHYFLGLATNASVLVCDSDDEDGVDFPYWVIVNDPVPWGKADLAVLIDPVELVKALTETGLEVRIV